MNEYLTKFMQAEVTASRTIETPSLAAGASTNVTVTIVNGDTSQALSLMETVPLGWTVTRVTDDADVFRPSTNEWVWFNVAAGGTKTVVYKLTAPLDAVVGNYSIAGNVLNQSGIIATVSGDNSIAITSGPATGNLLIIAIPAILIGGILVAVAIAK